MSSYISGEQKKRIPSVHLRLLSQWQARDLLWPREKGYALGQASQQPRGREGGAVEIHSVF